MVFMKLYLQVSYARYILFYRSYVTCILPLQCFLQDKCIALANGQVRLYSLSIKMSPFWKRFR